MEHFCVKFSDPNCISFLRCHAEKQGNGQFTWDNTPSNISPFPARLRLRVRSGVSRVRVYMCLEYLYRVLNISVNAILKHLNELC